MKLIDSKYQSNFDTHIFISIYNQDRLDMKCSNCGFEVFLFGDFYSAKYKNLNDVTKTCNEIIIQNILK